MRKVLFILLVFSFCSYSASGQIDSLRKKIRQLVNPVKADIGVAVKILESNDTLTVNGSRHYPMQSVFKFPLAMAMLHEVDAGKFTLDQRIGLTQEDFFPTHSPLMKRYPEGNAEVTLKEMLYETVYLSDNVGCDVMFRLLGGPQKVETYIHSLGVTDIAIRYNEREMHSDWNIPFKNWSTPFAMLQLLEVFAEDKKLSPASYDFLWNTMAASPTGPRRLRSGIPNEIVLVHKTGTGGRNEQGVVGAINDAGIILLPDGRKLAIVVFATNSLEPDEQIESVAAAIARTAFEFYSEIKK